ncbi:hypothetical protein Val02_66420 [Virgisporangium aliadipatigenens]|uniref:Uncharacterized protein n=1 Tax=Virgisporangium aliadipatigenens TaxID=741659 RepID=A0A8J3YQT8_9ACTN|nr:hypothetical protein [Virgisporangium aliadipatigenens]GIJ49756.1 hypothetical protein Val02_66420 [Virgisporangium aliadipatigenens]
MYTLIPVPLSLSPSPVAPPGGACVPGRDGVPDSVVGEVLCGTWGDDATNVVSRLVRDRWPLLLLVVAAVAGVRIGWALWRRAVWRAHAAQARWLAITPPVTATPAATLGLWRLLATVLPAPRRWALRPARLVWEVAADPHGLRCGLWLPPGVNPTAVSRLLQRGWPGVRAAQIRPPRLPTAGAVTALALTPTRSDWLAIVEDATPPVRHGVAAGAQEDDRLRAVFDGLASAGRTGGGLLQVHVGRAPAYRLRVLRRAMTHPDNTRRPRAAGSIAGALHTGVLAMLDLIVPGPATRRSPSARTDPYTADLARQARAKYADAPHLLVAVHAVAAGPTKAAARAAAADITSGFGLLSAHFTRRRLRAGPTGAVERWVPQSRMSVASIAEVAALAGLPAEPAAYGLPGAASRRRAATRDVFRTSGRTSGREIAHRKAAPAPDGGDDRDEPAARRTP